MRLRQTDMHVAVDLPDLTNRYRRRAKKDAWPCAMAGKGPSGIPRGLQCYVDSDSVEESEESKLEEVAEWTPSGAATGCMSDSVEDSCAARV